MSIPEIFDQYKRPPTVNEKGGGKRIVEPGGSLPVRVQIEQMLQAGMRLNDYRASKYDFEGDKEVPDDVEPDPTRNSNFDLADASKLARITAENLQKQADDAKRMADEKESAKKQEEVK